MHRAWIHRLPALSAIAAAVLLTQPAHAVELADRIDLHGYGYQDYAQTRRNTYRGADRHGTWDNNFLGLVVAVTLTEQRKLWAQLEDTAGGGTRFTWAFVDHQFNDALPAHVGRVGNDNLVDKSLIAKIYTGESKVWGAGGAIVAYDLPDDNGSRTAFDADVVGKSPGALKSLWTQNIFTGKAVPPKQAATDEDVKKAVSANKNAIGYIKTSSVDDTVKAVLK